MNTHVWHSGPARRSAVPAEVAVSCHRRLRGPYTGAGGVMRALVPAIHEVRPELVREHAIEILSVAAELKDRIGAAPETLTSLAVPEERTRIYAAVRTRRLAHGLTEFLHSYATLREPASLVLEFTDVDEADHTDQEFLAILLRRTRGTPIAVTVATRGQDVTDELATALARYARPCEPVPGRPDTGIVTADELLRAYVDSDGTSDDPAVLAAYEDAEPELRARLHDERAADLAREGEWSLRLGAIPYHLEHGRDPAKAGGDALHEAVYYCAGLGFWHAILDCASRARALTDPGNAERYWDFSGKMSSSLALLGRTREAESLYLEVRARYALPMAQMFTGYAMAMLYTRLHPPELRDHQLAKAYLSNTVTLAGLLPDAEERIFHSVFQRNGLALVEMHLGNLEVAYTLVAEGLERLDRELPAERHRLHRSVLVHNRGRVHAALGRLTEALADYTAVIGLDPNYPDYYFDRADLHRKLGDTDAALADYDKAISLSPPFWEVHFNRADLRARVGDPEGAIADLARVVELEPDQTDARVNLIDLLLESGATEAVAPLLDEGLRLDPGEARLLLVRGQLAWDSRRTDLARRDFDLAVEADPGCVPALASRAALAFESGDLDAALGDLTRAVDAEPDNPDLRYNRGFVHQAAQSWAAAVADYTHGLGLPDADAGELLRQRALCHRASGDTAAELADLDAARAVRGPELPAGAA